MKCPYCDGEMEAGVIQSPHEISWKYKKHFIGRAEFHDGSIVLSELSFLKGSIVQAFCCRKCEKIVIDYKDGNCDMNHAK
ncbi:MAG: PF20097 family protein [Syntrophomonadaceae bacterium]|nr:PF20097 family protein [Syntrophomonadaceae bacterium]